MKYCQTCKRILPQGHGHHSRKKYCDKKCFAGRHKRTDTVKKELSLEEYTSIVASNKIENTKARQKFESIQIGDYIEISHRDDKSNCRTGIKSYNGINAHKGIVIQKTDCLITIRETKWKTQSISINQLLTKDVIVLD